MAGFVVGNYPLLLGAKDEGFLLKPANNALDGLLEVGHYHVIGACAGSYEGCFESAGVVW